MKLSILQKPKPKVAEKPKPKIVEPMRFTIEEIRHFLHHWDTISDALYHLSEKGMLRSNKLGGQRAEPENFSE